MGRNTRWSWWWAYFIIWSILLVIPTGPIVARLPYKEFILERKFIFVKGLHVAAYAVLTLLSAWLRVPVRFRFLLVFFLMGHATLTEIIQEQIPGRTGELHDVAIDNLGIAIGLALGWKWWLRKDDSPSDV